MQFAKDKGHKQKKKWSGDSSKPKHMMRQDTKQNGRHATIAENQSKKRKAQDSVDVPTRPVKQIKVANGTAADGASAPQNKIEKKEKKIVPAKQDVVAVVPSPTDEDGVVGVSDDRDLLRRLAAEAIEDSEKGPTHKASKAKKIAEAKAQPKVATGQSVVKKPNTPKQEAVIVAGLGISSNWRKLTAANPKLVTRKTVTTTVKSTSETVVSKSVLLTPSDDAEKGPTKIIAVDCEMVGVGPEGIRSALARVSIVNQFGHVLLDKFVKPKEKVTDYRTKVSGIRPQDLVKASDFASVQKEVATLFNDRILVGHALKNDLQALLLSHPRVLIRDTSRYKPLKLNKRTPSLRILAQKILNISIQEGEHSSVEDARVAMLLYKKYRADWEQRLAKAMKKKAHNERARKQASSERQLERDLKDRHARMEEEEVQDGQPKIDWDHLEDLSDLEMDSDDDL